MNTTPAWLKLKQARAYSGLGRDTLRALADSGEVQAGHTPGGHRIWNRDSLDAYLKRGSIDALAIRRAVGL